MQSLIFILATGQWSISGFEKVLDIEELVYSGDTHLDLAKIQIWQMTNRLVRKRS